MRTFTYLFGLVFLTFCGPLIASGSLSWVAASPFSCPFWTSPSRRIASLLPWPFSWSAATGRCWRWTFCPLSCFQFGALLRLLRCRIRPIFRNRFIF
jgi:hypothetical protein